MICPKPHGSSSTCSCSVRVRSIYRAVYRGLSNYVCTVSVLSLRNASSSTNNPEVNTTAAQFVKLGPGVAWWSESARSKPPHRQLVLDKEPLHKTGRRSNKPRPLALVLHICGGFVNSCRGTHGFPCPKLQNPHHEPVLCSHVLEGSTKMQRGDYQLQLQGCQLWV